MADARTTQSATGTTIGIRGLFERLHDRAGFLDGEARTMVRNAHRIAGYESVRPGHIVEAVLRATAEITEAHTSG